MLQIWDLLRDTFDVTFVKPVQKGRPRPSTWPKGLAAVGAGALGLYGLLALAALFAVPLRRGPLILSPISGLSLPSAMIWLLLCAVILSFTLVHTAALHTAWWLRVLLFAVGCTVMFHVVSAAFVAGSRLVWVCIILYAGLLAFTIIRSFREYAWWEVIVVLAIVTPTMLLPGLVSTMGNFDRVVAIEGVFSSLSMLVFPALLVAGSAPAQIVVTAGQAAARRPVSRPLFLAMAGLALGWLVFNTARQVRAGSDDLNLQALIASSIVLVFTALALALWLRRARQSRPEPPSSHQEAWGAWLYPLAAVFSGLVVVVLVVTVVISALRIIGLTTVANAYYAAFHAVFDNNPGMWWRGMIGVVLLGIAWRISKQGRTAEAAVLGVVSVTTLLDALGLVPALAFLHERNAPITGLIATAAALLIGVVRVMRRSLDRQSAGWILTVVLLTVFFPFRGSIANPASVALAFSGPLLLLFSLTWRAVSGFKVFDGDSKMMPRPTRVLLFLANSLFAASLVAFVALSRAKGTDYDTGSWSSVGDWLLGEPLYTAGLVVALWLAVRPGPVR